MDLSVEELIALLGLQPHPREGGAFVETYRSPETFPAGPIPAAGSRSLATAIYYLITANQFSVLHRLNADEIFHFYLGDPVEMLQLRGDGSGRIALIGTDLARGMRPQVLVPRGVWQGSRLLPGGRWALLGTTMAPGFDDRDYEAGQAEPLIAAYPEFRERILALTR
jgi:predicted cupin superfamily sugar epimerase